MPAGPWSGPNAISGAADPLRRGGRRGVGGAEHQPCPSDGAGCLCAGPAGATAAVAKVFIRGVIDFRMVLTIINRTENVDDEVMAALDAALARNVEKWMKLSGPKLRDRIDLWVTKFDPAGVRVPPKIDDNRYVEIDRDHSGHGRDLGVTSTPPTPRRWIDAWMRWPPPSAKTTRAPKRSAAPMPCGPLARGEAQLWPASADRRTARRLQSATRGRGGDSSCSPSSPPSTAPATRPAICPDSASCPPNPCATLAASPQTQAGGGAHREQRRSRAIGPRRRSARVRGLARSDLPVAGLRRPGRALRYRPHGALPSRRHPCL